MKTRIPGRLRSAVGGIFLGFLLILAALAMLWFNEARAVASYRSIGELADFTVEISPQSVNPDNEGSPVYLTWRAQTDDVLRDQEFGIEKTALRLLRTVEMLQWREERPSSREYEQGVQPTYAQVWARERISSEEFLLPEEHENPPMPYITKTWMADKVMLGAFRLPALFILKLKNYVPVDATNAVPTIPENVIHEKGNLYIGKNPKEPQIGDLRISFQSLDPQPVSLIARQFGNTFDSFISRTGNIYAPIRSGVYSKEQLPRFERDTAKSLTVFLRMAGFFLISLGLMMVFSPFTLLTRRVPVIQQVARFGIGMLSALLGGILTLFTILIAWAAHRPGFAVGLGISILILALLCGFAFKKPDQTTRRPKKRMLATA